MTETTESLDTPTLEAACRRGEGVAHGPGSVPQGRGVVGHGADRPQGDRRSELGIRGTSGMRKGDLVAAITARQGQDGGPVSGAAGAATRATTAEAPSTNGRAREPNCRSASWPARRRPPRSSSGRPTRTRRCPRGPARPRRGMPMRPRLRSRAPPTQAQSPAAVRTARGRPPATTGSAAVDATGVDAGTTGTTGMTGPTVRPTARRTHRRPGRAHSPPNALSRVVTSRVVTSRVVTSSGTRPGTRPGTGTRTGRAARRTRKPARQTRTDGRPDNRSDTRRDDGTVVTMTRTATAAVAAAAGTATATGAAPATGSPRTARPSRRSATTTCWCPVAGILDVLDSYAFIRTSGYLTGPNDVYVSLSQVRKNGLRRGDAVTGAVRAQRDGEAAAAEVQRAGPARLGQRAGARAGPQPARVHQADPAVPERAAAPGDRVAPADHPGHRPGDAGRQGPAGADRVAAQGRQDHGHAGHRQRDHHEQPGSAT